MKSALIKFFIILLLNVSFASGFTANDIEWAPPIESTLYKGNTLTNGPYMVKAVQFPSPVPGFTDFSKNIVPETPVDPVVYLEVYKNDALMKEIVLSAQSGADIDKDYEMRVNVAGILTGNSKEWVMEYYKPWATISLALRGKPKFDVKVTTDKISYTSNTDDIITAKVDVTNSGDAVARNVDVDLNVGELKLRGGSDSQFHQNYLEFKKGETKSFEVILLVPSVSAEKSCPLSVSAKGYDVKDLEYAKTGSSSISVYPKGILPRVIVSKSLKNRMYLKDTMVVRVTVANGGDSDVFNINLTDIMNENFELQSETPLHWEIPVIKPGLDWSTTYSIKPLETNLNGFKIPAANAQFILKNRQYNVSSDAPSIIVNGPKILLNKTINKQKINISEDVTVTVSIKNSGNVATRTQVTDYLPEYVSLVSGSTAIDSIFLEVDKTQGFSYIIKPDREGDIELPAAIANYTGVEYRGTVRSAISSDRPVITVIDPYNITIGNNSNSDIPDNGTQTPISVTLPDTAGSAQTPTTESAPEIAPAEVTPFIEAFFTICVLIFAAAFMRK